MALKQAFWYLVNLYNADPKHKEMVLKVIIPFDQMLEMDKVIISSFYSYIPFDPEVSIVENGMTTAIIRPDLAEQKLLAAKEVVNYIRYYRTEQKKK
jgi:archaellum biogenesis ATPase FlaH